jgi:cytoskeletal protein RodZ
MVKIASGPLYFMSYSFLSVDFVEYSTESSEEPPESTPESSQTSESTKPPESTSQSTTPPPESSERPSESTTRPSESSEEPPESSERPPQPPAEERPAGGGIPYPDNPASTSINFGVVFADVNFTATTVSNNTVITSGPGKALPSNGYVELKTLYKGLTVTCTGIGQNGYIRILMDDGRVGFILNTNLKR